MNIGQLVMLIGTDGYMPPLGAIGEIVGGLDEMGDHEVLFPKHPCPVPPGITWEAHAQWLMPLNDGLPQEEMGRESAVPLECRVRLCER